MKQALLAVKGAIITAVIAVVKVAPFLLIIAGLIGLVTFNASSERTEAKNQPVEIRKILEVEEMRELVDIKESPDGSGYYIEFKENFGSKVSEIVEKSKKNAGVHNLSFEFDEEFLKKIIKAELITQYPNLGGNIPEGSDGFQGAIDIRRVTPDKEIGSIDDNPGEGETTHIEKPSVDDPVDTELVPQEEKVKKWQDGEILRIEENAIVYEQAESVLNPGSDTGKWDKKHKELENGAILNEYEEIPDGAKVTYLGTYKKSVNPLTKRTFVFILVEYEGKQKYIDSTNAKTTGEVDNRRKPNSRPSTSGNTTNKNTNSSNTSINITHNVTGNNTNSNNSSSNSNTNFTNTNSGNTDSKNNSLIHNTTTIDSEENTKREVTSRAKDEEEEDKVAGEGEDRQYVVAIAAGHNNSDDTGASYGNLKEEELTIKTAEKVEELLRPYNNITVVQVGSTSSNPSGVTISDRTALARQANPDLCIQIHFNAGGGSGVEAIYKAGDDVSRQLAEILSESMASSMGLENRGAGSDLEKCAIGSLSIIENHATSGFPSVVTEGGFIDGEPDSSLLASDGTEKCAKGIVDGILKYLKEDHSGYTSTEVEDQKAQFSVRSRVYDLKYVKPEEMEELIYKNDKRALEVYTLDENGKLITATWRYENGLQIKKNTPMDFSLALKNYIMPFEYLLYFYMNSNETDFVMKLADSVVKDTEMVLAIFDTVTTTQNTSTKEQRKVASDPEYSFDWRQAGSSVSTIETCTPSIGITYADAWCAKYYRENSLSRKALGWEEGQTESMVTIKGTVETTQSVSSGGETQIVNGATGYTGKRDEDGNAITYTYDMYERSNVRKKDMKIKYDIQKGQVDPKGEKFVKAYQETKIYNEIRDLALFALLENNERPANLADLTRYLIYKATGVSYNGIFEYDFEGEFNLDSLMTVGGGGAGAGGSGIYGGSIQEKVWFAVINAGYSKEAAAGVLGNIEAESGFNAGIVEGGSGIGFGLCQWSYGRREQLEAYAASKGKDPSDENTQIEFLIGEITPGGGANGYATYQLMYYGGYGPSDWENAISPEDAAVAFCWSFERPGVPRMDIRTLAARKYYDMFANLSAPSGTGDGSGGAIIDACVSVMNDMMSRGVVYSLSNLTWGNIDQAGTHPYACCATYVSVVLYKAGALTADQINAYNYNFTGAGGVPDMLAAAGWTQIPHDQIQPGDVINDYGNHVLIYAGGDLVYDQNCGVISSAGAPAIGGPYNAWSGYYGSGNVQVWRAP